MTLDVARIVDDPSSKVVVCCGAGGVGKTTTAAAIGLRAAEHGRNVVVLTIDPARRLAQSLGIDALGNTPQRVELPDAPGELHAMMLDMRRTFDDMVLAHTSPVQAEQIFANPFYQTVASSFGGTQEYMAMEKLSQLVAADRWDLVVVDTPPSRNALDFLDAPKRLGTFLDGKMIRLITGGGRSVSKLVTGAMSLALRGMSTVIGGQLLRDVSAFIASVDSMFGGFRERAEQTFELLSRPGTHFLVIAAPEPDALREASFFVDRLVSEQMPLAGLVVNRSHPLLSSLSHDHATSAADRLEGAAAGADDALTALTVAVLRVHAHRADTAERERHLLQRFTLAHPDVAVATVPALPFEVADLHALREVGDRLAG
jgi:anion-transporting  ArsA/GET3 family ATPase